MPWNADKPRGSDVEFALLTDVGRARGHNEDTCSADESAGLFVVCDGMGGAAGGEIASGMTARVFLTSARLQRDKETAENRLRKAVAEANRAVFAESERDSRLRGMGTTLSAVELDVPGGTLRTVNVGDSRCYRLRAGALQMLTEDHSFVDEQVRRGEMTAAEAITSPLRNVITRAVGSHIDVEADVALHMVESGDLYLLCTDGLTRELSDAEIEGVLRACEDRLPDCARALVHMANEYGGSDNITVILLRVR